MNDKVNLPYFDYVLEKKCKGDDHLKDSLHMHWGYWDYPNLAKPKDRKEFNDAADRLCRIIVDQVDLSEGCKLADVGCGFGGTIDSINKACSGLDIIGLNIDPRQIEVAESRVKASNGNQIKFIIGDACALPFEDASLDALLAIECIFHFPDREKFFAEATRVLKPGGKFAFSDFVPIKKMDGKGKRIREMFERSVSTHFGDGSEALTLRQYNELARSYNLKSTCEMDVTANTMPTFTALFDRIDWRRKGAFSSWFARRILWFSQKSGEVRYTILGYQKAF